MYSDSQLSDAYDYCRRLTIKSDSNFNLGFRFLPKLKRKAIYAVYAFNRFADDFVDEVDSPFSGKELIKKWEENLHRCYNREKVDNPVLIAFTDAVHCFDIPKQAFLDAIEGFKMDLKINRYNTFDDLLLYCTRVAGTISTMSLSIFGYKDEEAVRYGRDLSTALQLTNIIRDVRKDAEKGRIYIPLDELKRFQYSEEDLFAKATNSQFMHLMQFQVNRAREYYRRAFNLVKYISPDCRLTVLLMGGVYGSVLNKTEKLGYNVFNNNVTLSSVEKYMLVLRQLIRPKFV